MGTTKNLDELIDLLNAIRPLSLYTKNLEHFDDKSAYEFGCNLGKRLCEEEYNPTLEQTIKLYHSGLISKLGADMKTLVYVCTNTLQEITPGFNFSVQSFEIHVRASARVAAYYAIIQLYLRHPSVTSEKIIAKLGQEFYDSLMKAIGSALSLKYVQQYIHSWNILNWIEETAKKIEDKISSSVLQDKNIVNRIINIAKCEQFEIRAALAIAVKWEKEFKNLAALQYSIDGINAEITKAEKHYELNKAAELKYGKLKDLQNQFLILEDEIKTKTTEYIAEFTLKNIIELPVSEACIDINKTEALESLNEPEKPRENKSGLILPNLEPVGESLNEPEKPRENKSGLILPNLEPVVAQNSEDKEEVLQPENIFIQLQQYLSDLCKIPLENITLESTVFSGDFTSLKPSSSGLWGSLSSGEYSEKYDAPENSLGMDALDGVELMIFIEEEFDIDIPDEYYSKIMTIAELINIIMKIRDDG